MYTLGIMAKMTLSETWLKANNSKARVSVQEFADRDGMSARLSQKGKIVYQLRYRLNGKACRIDIGSYPLMSLKDARNEALRLKAMIEQGKDPRIERQVERQAIIEADSVSMLFDKWYSSYCVNNKKSHAAIKRSFEIHIFPKIGGLPIGRVTLQQWLLIFEPLSKSNPAISERLLINTKQMLKWAVKRRIIDENVLADIYAREDLDIKPKPVDRVLSDTELKMFWMAVDESYMDYRSKLFLKLCLVFGCRNGELRIAQKTHFDLDNKIWITPPENHKTGKNSGKPIIRPIVPYAENLIREAMELNSSNYLFAKITDDSVMGPSSALQFPYRVMQHLKTNHNYIMEHWSLHDLRRTMRTNISELVPQHIAEIMLGHAQPKIVGTYDKFLYLKEQEEGYQKWIGKLLLIVGENQAT